MNRSFAYIVLTLLAMASCKAPSEPASAPPDPAFVPNSAASDPIDRGIFADVSGQNAIDIQWEPDSTVSTSGYILYRANDSSTGTDGLLVNRQMVAQLESSNPLLIPVETSFVDTIGIVPGGTYFYQLQAYSRASNNSIAYSKPTVPGLTTSFHFAARPQPLEPNGVDTLHGFPLQLSWQDPNGGGNYRIFVQRLDNQQFTGNWTDQEFQNMATTTYPDSVTPLISGIEYQWRVKYIERFGGSTSPWTAFSVEP